MHLWVIDKLLFSRSVDRMQEVGILVEVEADEQHILQWVRSKVIYLLDGDLHLQRLLTYVAGLNVQEAP